MDTSEVKATPLVKAESVRVLIADDDPRVRRGLRALFEAEPGIVLVGEAGNAAELVKLVQALEPAVILLDLRLPGGEDGLGLLRLLADQQGRHVVAISVRGGLREAALGAGACAFLEKGARPETILRTLSAADVARRARLAARAESAA